MKKRKTLTKSGLYSLVRDIVGNIPKMKETEFHAYKGACWLEYRDIETDHLMKICLDSFGKDTYMIIDDKTDRTSRTVHLNIEI